MVGRYKAYLEYKESYQKWIGEIPSHWNIWRAKRVFSAVREPAKDTDEQLAASQKYGVIPQSLMMELNSAKVMLALKGTESFRHVEQDNFVISLRSFEGGIEHSAYEGCVSPAYTVLKASKFIYSHYFKYLLKCEPFIAALQSSTDSLRDGKSISYEQFGAISLPYCNHEEQKGIANFLDHEIAKIDNLIAKQEKLIELLKEKCQAVISHAVTKGLNPDVPMKDSGVEWLGKVPEHWGKIAFKQIIKTRKGVAFSSSDFCDSGIRVVKASDIKQLTLNKSDVFLPEAFVNKYPKAYLAQGNIILSTVGSTPDVKNSAVGQIAIVPEELDKTLLNQNTVVFDPKGEMICRDYLFWLLQTRAYRDHLDLYAHGTANQASLNVADMLSFRCFIPPIDEQKRISEYLQQFLDKVSNLETKMVTIIELIKERKTALISAAVTGKIDVRDWDIGETDEFTR